jgi:hypothetical protein
MLEGSDSNAMTVVLDAARHLTTVRTLRFKALHAAICAHHAAGQQKQAGSGGGEGSSSSTVFEPAPPERARTEIRVKRNTMDKPDALVQTSMECMLNGPSRPGKAELEKTSSRSKEALLRGGQHGSTDFLKKLVAGFRVKFEGEPGSDLGGIIKEWCVFMLFPPHLDSTPPQLRLMNRQSGTLRFRRRCATRRADMPCLSPCLVAVLAEH